MSKVFLFIGVLLLYGCATQNLREDATNYANSHGFSAILFPTKKFDIFGFFKPGESSVLRIYIEGDGHAWVNRTTPSKDPTPHNPVSLYLAGNDPSRDHVLYLARPCQYVQGKQCRQQYWTKGRMGEDVIASLDSAIDQAQKLCGATKLCLVGFSGGGGCAALIAARRGDVVFLGSVAGNLNMNAWTHKHHLSAMDLSIDPISVAPNLCKIPQRHYSSNNDKVVPPDLSEDFCKSTGQPAACRTVQAMKHGDAWHTVWNYDYPVN